MIKILKKIKSKTYEIMIVSILAIEQKYWSTKENNISQKVGEQKMTTKVMLQFQRVKIVIDRI